jgi:hypothetical protein
MSLLRFSHETRMLQCVSFRSRPFGACPFGASEGPNVMARLLGLEEVEEGRWSGLELIGKKTDSRMK